MSADDQMHVLRDTVQRLRDIEEIKQLKARYLRCVDSKDWDGWGRDVVSDDFHFESEAGVLDGRDEVIAVISKAMSGAKTVHHGHTPEITITGPDMAAGVWAMNDYVELPGKGGSPYVQRGYGHYTEEYVRTDNGWRIKSTKLTRLRVDTTGVPDLP